MEQQWPFRRSTHDANGWAECEATPLAGAAEYGEGREGTDKEGTQPQGRTILSDWPWVNCAVSMGRKIAPLKEESGTQ